MKWLVGAPALFLLIAPVSAQTLNNSLNGGVSGGSLSGDNLRAEVQGGVAAFGMRSANGSAINGGDQGSPGGSGGVGTYYGNSAYSGSIYSGDTSSIAPSGSSSCSGDCR